VRLLQVRAHARAAFASQTIIGSMKYYTSSIRCNAAPQFRISANKSLDGRVTMRPEPGGADSTHQAASAKGLFSGASLRSGGHSALRSSPCKHAHPRTLPTSQQSPQARSSGSCAALACCVAEHKAASTGSASAGGAFGRVRVKARRRGRSLPLVRLFNFKLPRQNQNQNSSSKSHAGSQKLELTQANSASRLPPRAPS
jgi:hypothetical protein